MRLTLAAACTALIASVSAAAPPANDACDAATAIVGLPVMETTSVTGAMLDADEPPASCVSTSAGSVWYAITVPADGELALATQGSDYDTVVSVYEGLCGALEERACNDDATSSGLTSLVSLPVIGGETLLLRVAAYGSTDPGRLVLTAVLDGPPNDDCATPIDVPELPFLDETTTVGAGAAPDEPGCRGGFGTVWYRFTPSEDGSVVVDTASSDFDTVLAAYEGDCETLDLLTCGDDGATRQADLSVPVTANVPVRFQVGGYEEGEVGSLRFHVSQPAPPMNDACEAPEAIAVLPASLSQFVQGATRDPAPASTCGGGSASVWYEIVPPAAGLLTVDTAGSDYDTVLEAFSGPCDATILRDCDDDTGGTVTSRIRFGVGTGEHIRVAASAYGDGAGRTLVLNARLDPCFTAAECGHPDACTAAACLDGACVFTDVPECCRSNGDCDDGDVCTIDTCTEAHTCHTDVRAGCCRSDPDCDDGDPCTVDACTDDACGHDAAVGIDLAACRLHDDPTCGSDALPARLRLVLGRRLERAAALRERAEAATRPGRRQRLLERASKQLRTAQRRLDRTERRERVSADCAAVLRAALAAALGGA